MAEPTPQQPKPTTAASKQPEIHVMPEQFYGAALAYREPKAPPPQARGGAAPIPPSGVRAKKPPVVLFVIIGLVFLGVLGVGGYFLLRPQTKPAPVVNKPAPANVNANRPTNANRPVNANANVNANTNVNANVPANVNANVPPPPPPPGTPLRSSIDSDVDGLTDTEEALYGTGITRPDSDGDGFLDGNEVFNLYNPAALAPTTLRDSGLVLIHEDPSFGFEILYPAAWTRRTIDAAAGAVTFTASSGEFIQVSVEVNPLEQNAADWYLARSPGVSRTELDSVMTKGGYSAVRSPDRLVTYIASGTRVYVISYNIGNLAEVSYRQSYEMMVNSFRVTQVVFSPAPPSASATSTATSTP